MIFGMPTRHRGQRFAAGLVILAWSAASVDSAAVFLLNSQKDDAHSGSDVRAVDFFSSGNTTYVVSGGDDAVVKRWSLPGLVASGPVMALNHPIFNLEASNELASPVVLTGEGKWNGSPDGNTLRLLSGDPLAELAGTITGGYNYCVAVSPASNGKVLLASSGYYGDVKIQEYDESSPNAFTTKPTIDTGNDRRVDALAFVTGLQGSPLRIARSLLKKIDIYEDDGSGTFIFSETLDHGGKWENFMAASADGSRVASGTDGSGENLKIWNVMSSSAGNLAEVSAGGTVYSIAFSRDGSYLAAGGSTWIRIYNADDLTLLAEDTNAHGGSVDALAFGLETDAAGPFSVASGSSDGSLKLWTFTPDGGSTGTTTTTTTVGSGTTATTTNSPPSSCAGLTDSKGKSFCARKADSWCPPNGNTAQCDWTCCCHANSGAVGCV